MGAAVAFLYGAVVYVFFLGTFLYAIGFVGNIVVSKTIDSGASGPVGEAILVNVVLMGLFAIQHNVMARVGFKRWWTRIVPRSVERSTFVLMASLLLALMMWQWRPLTDPVWDVESAAGAAVLHALFWLGWALVLISTFLINHFDLFGLRQVWLNLKSREYGHPRFATPAFYKIVRHPLLLGFVIAFWATPHMTVGHLLFAVVTTVWMLISIPLEERDLVGLHGDAYREYQSSVPALIPFLKRKRG